MPHNFTRRALLATTAATAAGGLNLAFAAASVEPPFVRVSPRDPRHLELTDGTTFIPNGCNLVAAWSKTPELAAAQMVTWLDKLAANQGNFIRIWLSAPAWDVEHETSGKFDPDRAKTISTMLAAARKHGIRVKMTLEHFRSIVPTSQSSSNKSLPHTSVGGPAKDTADFLANPACRKRSSPTSSDITPISATIPPFSAGNLGTR